jgi:DNA polymerase III delta prime subunit
VSEIFGHGPVLERLRRAVAANRLPHGLLFSGPDGVGKRTVAEAFARELLATDDESRARFDHGAHDQFVTFFDLEKPLPVRRRQLLAADLDEDALLEAYAYLEAQGWLRGATDARGPDVSDLLERNPERFVGRTGIPFADVLGKELASLDRAKKVPAAAVAVARRVFATGTSRVPYRRNLGIELINGRGDGAYFRTIESLLRSSRQGWRIAVLDDCDRMTDAAENAFLKTLEEPPENTLLILVTSRPLSLLPTTASRCAPVVFDGLPAPEIARFLETQGVRGEEATLLGALADGSVRKALELRGWDLARQRAALEEILRAVVAGDLTAILGWIGHRIAEGADKAEGRDAARAHARLVLEHLALGFRDLVLARAAPDVAGASGLSPDVARSLAAGRPPWVWERLFDRTGRALADVDASVDPRLALEALFVEAAPLAAAGV